MYSACGSDRYQWSHWPTRSRQHVLCMFEFWLLEVGFCSCTVHAAVIAINEAIDRQDPDNMCCVCLSLSCWRLGSAHVQCMRQWSLSMKPLTDKIQTTCVVYVWVLIVGGWVLLMYSACGSDRYQWSHWPTRSRQHVLCMFEFKLLEVGFCSCTVHAAVIAINEAIDRQDPDNMCCVYLSFDCWRLGSAHVQCMRQWSLSMKPLTDKIQTTCVVYVWVLIVGGWVLLMYSACGSDRYQWSHWPTRSRQHVLCMFEFRLLKVGFCSCTVHAAVIAINEAIDRQDPDNMCCVCLSFDCWRLGSTHVQCMRQWSLSMKPLTDKIQTTCVVYVWVLIVGGWVLLMYSACGSDRYQWSHWPTRSRQHISCLEKSISHADFSWLGNRWRVPGSAVYSQTGQTGEQSK